MLFLSESLQESPVTDSQEPDALPSELDAGGEGGRGPQTGPPPHQTPASPGPQAQPGEALPGDSHQVLAPRSQARAGLGVGAGVLSASQAPAAKPKKDRLARLRELGMDPPPVPKLCADDGQFVDLEPPAPNPGKETQTHGHRAMLRLWFSTGYNDGDV